MGGQQPGTIGNGYESVSLKIDGKTTEYNQSTINNYLSINTLNTMNKKEVNEVALTEPKQGESTKMQKGNKRGKKFSRDCQPAIRGRKLTRMNELKKAFNLEDPARAISHEDATKLMTHILMCNRSQLEAMIKNTDLPIFLLCLIKGILTDTANGQTNTVERLFDRLFGRSMQPVEITGANRTPLIPSKPMSRKSYEAMLNELQTTGQIKQTAITVSNN